MTHLADGITAILSPSVAIDTDHGLEAEIVIDVMESLESAQTLLKTRGHDGQLHIRSLSEIAGIAEGPPVGGTLGVKELSARLAERRDIEALLAQASAPARERAALRGWLVGLVTTGRPIDIPGAPQLSWSPPTTDEYRPLDSAQALACLRQQLDAGSIGLTHVDDTCVSARSLRRWKKSYLERGLAALVHDSLGSSRLERMHQSPAVKDFATSVASRTAQQGAKITRTRFLDLCLLEAAEVGIAPLPDSSSTTDDVQTHRLIRHFAVQAHRYWALNKTLSQRRTREISRKSSSPSIYRDRIPFTEIQIDATPLDSYALNQHGQQVSTIRMLFATDVASSSYIDSVILPCEPTARDVTDFIIQMILRVTDRHGSHLLAPDRLATIAVGELVTDRGSNMIAEEVTAALAVLGIDVKSAGAGRGDQKGIVEAVQGKANDFARLIHGAHGATQREGPRFNPKDRYLTVDQWQTLIRAWGHQVYNRTPKDRLRPSGYASAVTPQMYVAAFHDVLPPPDRPFPVDALKGLLEHRRGVLTSQGVEFGGYSFVWPIGIDKPHLDESTRTTTGHNVTVYGPHRFPQYVIVDAVDANNRPISLVLLRSDVYAQQTRSDVLDLVIEGLDPTTMKSEAKDSQKSADNTRLELAHSARAEASQPTAPEKKTRRKQPSSLTHHIPDSIFNSGNPFTPTQHVDQAAIDAEVAKYLAIDEDEETS
jgi:hypothetical protein